jgi:dTDP-4-amino-4,6-dideoxygalactose transaminase
MTDKKIMVTSPAMPKIEEFVEEIKDLWESRWLTHTGPKHIELEEKLEKYLGVRNISLFANGHLALELAIKAMGLKGEVITTPFTFASTTQSIMRNEIEPVFCDINREDFTLDVTKIERLITDKTSAIIPVHVYGNVCDMESIEKIAKQYNLKVIYDAAHAFGIEVNGRKIAAFGDASMFSFHATKVFNTVEGGAVAFENDELVKVFNRLKQFGMELGTDLVPCVGTNAKMTEMHAAMGLCNLRHIDSYISKRKTLVERYREYLTNIPGIKICKDQVGVKHNYAYFPILFDPSIFRKDRDCVIQQLMERNIFAKKYFYPLNSDFECYRNRYGGERVDVPVASQVADQVLTLPLYPDLEVCDIDKICKIILQ